MRKNDFGAVNCFRSNRFFSVSGRWYFSTREGEDLGPFASRDDAETGLARYLDTQFVIHYLRGADPTITGDNESSERLVARMSAGLRIRGDSAEPSHAPVQPSAGEIQLGRTV